MKIVTDYKMKDYEEKLHQMSIECEAPVGGIPQSISSLGQHSVSKLIIWYYELTFLKL